MDSRVADECRATSWTLRRAREQVKAMVSPLGFLPARDHSLLSSLGPVLA
jgi:hypothetical protein